jgi:hypothetical protein
MTDLDKAKIQLWLELSKIPSERLSLEDANLFFEITKNQAIQDILADALEKKSAK